MKKNLLYALALATTMVACTDDDYTDWGLPQQNDPEAAKSVSLSVSAAETIDFATVTDEYVTIFTSPTATADPGATVEKYTVTVEGKYTLPVTMSQSNGQVAAADLEAALVELFGRRPTERTMTGLVKAYVKNTDGITVIPTATVTIKATPNAPIIEDAYYLVGTPNGWLIPNGDYQFKHSGKDVYEDPIFTLTFAAPVDATTGERIDCWFKISPKSSFEAREELNGFLGCATNGSQDMEGTLVPKSETVNPGAMNLPASDGAKFYKITLNMMDYTYSVEILEFEEYIYIPGDHQAGTTYADVPEWGWYLPTAPALWGANFDGTYTGFSYLKGGFKFTRNRENWDGEYNYSSFTQYSEGLTGEGSGNITMENAGFYYIEANTTEGILTVTPMEWTIIGSATGDSNWGTDLEMTYVTEDESWTYTGALVAGEFKFRANKDWALSFGGASFEDLTSDNGANLKITEDGNYEVKFFLTRSTTDKIYCTVTKK